MSNTDASKKSGVIIQQRCLQQTFSVGRGMLRHLVQMHQGTLLFWETGTNGSDGVVLQLIRTVKICRDIQCASDTLPCNTMNSFSFLMKMA